MLNNEREGIILMDINNNSSLSAQNDTTSIAIAVSRVPKQKTAKKISMIFRRKISKKQLKFRQ